MTNTPLCPDNPSALYRKKLKDKTEHPSCFLHQRIISTECEQDLGLQIRIGIATGAAAMSFIYGSSSIAPIICTTGSTMVRAARLEAAGRPRFVHVCAATIRKLRDEDFDFQGRDPDTYLISGSFKGLDNPTMSAWFSCEQGVLCTDASATKLTRSLSGPD